MRSTHRRWPFGYPQASFTSRAQLFNEVGAGDRMRATKGWARQSFQYLNLAPPVLAGPYRHPGR